MKTIWILIYVHHGLIQPPELFPDKTLALARRSEILQRWNKDYDEVELFESNTPV
jgi:hypothetical protein